MDEWKRVADLLVQARLEQGYRRRTDLVRDKGLKHDRVLNDLENAKRSNYSPATLFEAETIYGLEHGTIARVLAGEDVPVPVAASDVRATGKGVLLDLPDEAVEGMTDLQVREAVAKAEAAFLAAAAEIKNRDRSD